MPEVSSMTTQEPTPRARFRALLALMVENHPELSSGELAELVGRTLPDEDRHLVSEFLTSEARNILAWEMRAQFVRTRQGIYSVLDLANPDSPAISDLEDAARESVFERISQWREFVPSEGRARPLLQMTKQTLLESAQYDAATVFRHGWKMKLKTRLADGLPDDDTSTVADVFSAEQVLTLGETIKKEMTRGNFRLAIKPIHAISRRAPVSRQGDGRDSQGSKTD
jgi:hypothetical protein